MSKASDYLRRCSQGFSHWCPGCHEIHVLPDSWQFNGDLDKPTFQPSFKHGGVKRIVDEKGHWTGEWERDQNGKPIPFVCHYILTNGVLNFCGDCTHALVGQSVALPKLPDFYAD